VRTVNELHSSTLPGLSYGDMSRIRISHNFVGCIPGIPLSDETNKVRLQWSKRKQIFFVQLNCTVFNAIPLL